jgi:hypothetical protein
MYKKQALAADRKRACLLPLAHTLCAVNVMFLMFVAINGRMNETHLEGSSSDKAKPRNTDITNLQSRNLVFNITPAFPWKKWRQLRKS